MIKIETRTDGIIRLKKPKRHRNWEKIRKFLEEVEVFIRSIKLKNQFYNIMLVEQQYDLFYIYTLFTANTDISSYFWVWVGLYKTVSAANTYGQDQNMSPGKVCSGSYVLQLCEHFLATWSYYITGRHHSGGFYRRYICSARLPPHI